METTTTLKDNKKFEVSPEKDQEQESSHKSFSAWFKGLLDYLQFYRLGVMGFILMAQGNVIAPATILAILYNSQGAIQFLLVTLLSFSVLVTNIAERPARETVPLFIISTFIHLVIILINVL